MNSTTEKIFDILSKQFVNPKSELDFSSTFELLVAVILSAQCTDKRVNLVTKELFRVANTPEQFVEMPQEVLESYIHSCGFYHNKAKHIKQACHTLVTKYNGEVPNNIEQLQTLDGVGRKTANVVYAVGFGGQAIAVDTHVFRVSNRLGLASATNVLSCEKQLMKAISVDMWADAHHYILLHGRYVCKSTNPQCGSCVLVEYCKYFKEKKGV